MNNSTITYYNKFDSCIGNIELMRIYQTIFLRVREKKNPFDIYSISYLNGTRVLYFPTKSPKYLKKKNIFCVLYFPTKSLKYLKKNIWILRKTIQVHVLLIFPDDPSISWDKIKSTLAPYHFNLRLLLPSMDSCTYLSEYSPLSLKSFCGKLGAF